MNQQDSAPTDRCNILFFDPVRSSRDQRKLQYPSSLKEEASFPPMPRKHVCDGIRDPQRAPESEFIRNPSTIREREALAPTAEIESAQKGRKRKAQFPRRDRRQHEVGYLRSAALSILTLPETIQPLQDEVWVQLEKMHKETNAVHYGSIQVAFRPPRGRDCKHFPATFACTAEA